MHFIAINVSVTQADTKKGQKAVLQYDIDPF